MAQTAELDVHSNSAPDTIEATLNYIVDDGKPVFTIVAAPGGSDTRSGATPDPHRVTIHNGRQHGQRFRAGEERLRLRAPRHQGQRLLRRSRNHAHLLSGDGRTDQSPERRQARRRVRPHAAYRRRRTARGEEDPRGRAPRAQRLHRMVGAAARARHPAGRGRGIAQAPLRHHPGVAADPPSRSRRSRSPWRTLRRCRRTT